LEILNIITRVTRPENLEQIKESIFKSGHFKFKWWVYFDTRKLEYIDTDLLSKLTDSDIYTFFKPSIEGDYGHYFINDALDRIDSGWVYVLDDDNILHEDFAKEISCKIEEMPKLGFLFHQDIGGRDFTLLDKRIVNSLMVKVGHIDMAQFVLKRDLIGESRFIANEYKADGFFIEKIWENNSESIAIIDSVLCYYNFLKKENLSYLPRVLVMGSGDIELKSNKIYDYEDNRLNVLYTKDTDLNIELARFNPDSILTIGGEFTDFHNLSNKNLDIRRRWIHSPQIIPNIGNWAYSSAMNYILDRGIELETPLISFFTPVYNTGNKLIRTYNSIKNQKYDNWEWVIVNDSSDGGKTLKIAENLAKYDSRIEIYDFRKKTGGIIGESKYRAATLCRGKYIIELDHDDIVTEDAALFVVNGFKAYPECKFIFSDCSEIDENFNSLTYGDSFAFGYGSYRDENWSGKSFKVATCPSINPKTIRHIVGCPNHLRAWDRDFYNMIGGHSRRLSVADDYELVVRSFLKTRFLCIQKMLYLQFHWESNNSSNTQNLTRGDIQRRVRTISNFYNEKIKKRFDELGLEDWAWNENKENPIMTNSRFGQDQSMANLIWSPE
jgi:O-antigen biosynthesis protein